MWAHDTTLPLKPGAKSGHNELTKKERAHYSDEAKAGLLGWVLGDDAHFQGLVATLASVPPRERRTRAKEQARDYAPYDGPHRDHIAELLLAGAAPMPERIALWGEGNDARRATMRRYLLGNLSARGVWAEAPLEDTDAQRVRNRQDRLREGALYVARFGAYTCLNCEARLAHDSRSGRAHPTHCSPCSAAPWEAGRQREAMREALDAGTDQRRARRARRRAPAP